MNLTQFSLLPFTYSKCVQKSQNSKHQNLVENSKIIWEIHYKSLRISPPCVRCIEIAITIQFAPKQVSSLQKFITFIQHLKWRPKFQYGKTKKYRKTFIYNTKHDFYNRVPKMGLEHKCVSFWLNPCSSSKHIHNLFNITWIIIKFDLK